MLGRLTENRAVSFQTVWGSGADIELMNPAGVNINNNTAFEIVAFFSAVSLISDTISTLPVDALYRADGEIYPYRPRPAWVDQPDVDNTRQAHYQQVLVSLLVSGNSFTRVFRDTKGEVVNLIVLDPTTVEIKRNALGRKMFQVEKEAKLLTSEEIVHITDLLEPGALRGMSRVSKLSDALGVASALQSYAATFFGQCATTSGVIEFPGPLLTSEQAKNLQDGFDSRHKGWKKAHKTGILSGGATYKQTSVPNDSAQFLESRRFAVEEIARAFNIPLHLLGVPDTASYASVEQNAIQFVTHTLRPYVEKIEWAYTRLLPTPAYLKFNVNGLMRGDFQTRIQAYSVASQAGFMSVNDIRRLEDLRSVEGGDVYRVPLANVNLSASDLPEQEGKVAMATKLINAGFDPASTLKALGLPAILHDGGVPTTIQPMTTTGA
jgi:HK97 family phage portal protein